MVCDMDVRNLPEQNRKGKPAPGTEVAKSQLTRGFAAPWTASRIHDPAMPWSRCLLVLGVAGPLAYAVSSLLTSDEERIRRRLGDAITAFNETRLRGAIATGSAEFELVMERRSGSDWASAWELHVDAELHQTTDGWPVVTARHATGSGRRPR